MRFLAPFQYVAFKLPFHIPYQSGALIYTTFCNMATPHTLIAISLFPAGVAGVAVTLLRLLREVNEGVESVDSREGVGRGGGSITTPE